MRCGRRPLAQAWQHMLQLSPRQALICGGHLLYRLTEQRSSRLLERAFFFQTFCTHSEQPAVTVHEQLLLKHFHYPAEPRLLARIHPNFDGRGS